MLPVQGGDFPSLLPVQKQKGKDKEREGPKEGEDRSLAEQAAAAAPAAGRSPPHAGCAAAAIAAGALVSGGAAGPNLRTAVAVRAQKFRAVYLPSQGRGAQLETEGVQRLREVCRDLGGEGKVQELLALIQVGTVKPASWRWQRAWQLELLVLLHADYTRLGPAPIRHCKACLTPLAESSCPYEGAAAGSVLP